MTDNENSLLVEVDNDEIVMSLFITREYECSYVAAADLFGRILRENVNEGTKHFAGHILL